MTETIKTLTEQSNSAVANYKAEQNKLEKEQIELRKQAFLKILAYLREIKDVGFRGCIEFEDLYLYWLCKPSDKNRNVSKFWFTNDHVEIYESSYGSSLNKQFDDNDRWLSNVSWDDIDMKHLVKQLVSQWKDIKPKLESKLQECLVKRMNDEEGKKNAILAMNETLANFEV